MVLLENRVGCFSNFPFGRKLPAAASTAPLHNFRSKVLAFAADLQIKPRLRDLGKCFELITFVNRAFSDMVVEIDYPMSRWESPTAEEYFYYTLNLLDMLNLINAAVLRLRHSRISVSHTLKLIPGYHTEEPLKKILERIRGKKIIQPTDSDKERMAVAGLAIAGDTGVLSLAFVLSCLCSERGVYLETRESIISIHDSSPVKGLDLRFSENGDGVTEEVKEVNVAVEGIASTGEGVERLEMALELLEKGIEGIEKAAEALFSEAFAARNKLLDCYRDELSRKP